MKTTLAFVQEIMLRHLSMPYTYNAAYEYLATKVITCAHVGNCMSTVV